MIGQADGGKIVRPAPMKLNVWASVVARPQQQKAAQAPKKSQAPEPEDIVEEPIAEVPIIEAAEPIAEAAEPNEAKVLTADEAYMPSSYAGSWADM